MPISKQHSKVKTTIPISDLFPHPVGTPIVSIMNTQNTHSQHHEHPKLIAFIMFMSKWENLCTKIAIGGETKLLLGGST